MSLRFQLVLAVLLTFIIPALFFFSFHKHSLAQEKKIAHLLDIEVPSLVRIQEMRAILWDLRGLPALYQLSGRESWVTVYTRRKAQLDILIDEAGSKIPAQEEGARLEQLKKELANFDRLNHQIRELYRQGKTGDARVMVLSASFKAMVPVEESLQDLTELISQRAKLLQDERALLEKKMRVVSWGGVLGFCLALSGVMLIGIKAAKRLSRMETGVKMVGKGVLSHRLPGVGSDEISRLERGFNRMAESLESARNRLYRQTQLDGLTGAFNRHFLKREMAQRSRGERISLILFDIDHFKYYNDANGHLLGDEALKKVARLAKRCCGRRGFLVRYGGEEFLVLLPGAREDYAKRLAEDIRKKIADADFPGEKKIPGGRLTISLGLASGEASSRKHLLQTADEALYCSKKDGRNRVSVRN